MDFEKITSLNKLLNKEFRSNKRPAVTYSIQTGSYKPTKFLKPISLKLFSITHLENDRLFGKIFCGTSSIQFEIINNQYKLDYLGGNNIWEGNEEEIINFILLNALKKLENPFTGGRDVSNLKGAYLRRLSTNHNVGKKGEENLDKLIQEGKLSKEAKEICKNLGVIPCYPNKNSLD